MTEQKVCLCVCQRVYCTHHQCGWHHWLSSLLSVADWQIQRSPTTPSAFSGLEHLNCSSQNSTSEMKRDIFQSLGSAKKHFFVKKTLLVNFHMTIWLVILQGKPLCYFISGVPFTSTKYAKHFYQVLQTGHSNDSLQACPQSALAWRSTTLLFQKM